MKNRKEILIDIIRLNGELSQLENELKSFPWDSKEDIYCINDHDILNILNLYKKSEIDKSVLEEWANTLECREDIGFEKDYLQEIIFELSNPALNGDLIETRLNFLMQKLNK